MFIFGIIVLAACIAGAFALACFGRIPDDSDRGIYLIGIGAVIFLLTLPFR